MCMLGTLLNEVTKLINLEWLKWSGKKYTAFWLRKVKIDIDFPNYFYEVRPFNSVLLPSTSVSKITVAEFPS